MRYTDFFDEFIRYLYRDSTRANDLISFESLVLNNEIPYEAGYLSEVQLELKSKGFLRGPDPIGGDETAVGKLTGEGMRYVESLMKDDLPEGPSGWRELRAEVAPTDTQELVSASDRLVPLDHNLPDYMRVKDGLNEIFEAARSVNDLADRDRILSGLAAAQSLWKATELKIIQIKIGVVMAIEDAGRALEKTSKTVATSLLIDAIKSLVKSKTGLDLDNI